MARSRMSAVDLGAEGAQQVEHQPDDDQVDPDVEEDRRDQVQVAEQRQVQVDHRGLQHHAAEGHRQQRSQRRHGEAAADQAPASTGAASSSS